MWVESPELTNADSEDGNLIMEQMLIQLSLPALAIAWQPTELIVDLEPVKFEVAEEEISLPQTAGQIMEETEAISTQESVV